MGGFERGPACVGNDRSVYCVTTSANPFLSFLILYLIILSICVYRVE